MDALVNETALQALYTSPKERLYAAPPMIHILVTHYNTPTFLEKCLQTLFSQICSVSFLVHLVDDCSDMKEVNDLLNVWEAKEPVRLRIYRNTTRQKKGRNLFQLLEKGNFNQEDILGIVDGDDWLAHNQVFQRVIDEYVKTDCWVTYGSYMCSDGKTGNCTKPLSYEHIESEARGRGFREAPWVFSHFFTAKAFLWLKLKQDILIFDGKLEENGPADQLFNIPLAEMASSNNISNISDILYVYNNESPFNDCVVRPQTQELYDKKNREKEPYKAIERPFLDFLIVLPCRGRFPLLDATIKRLQEEKQTNLSVEIVLVEHSEEPSYKNYAKQKGIGWIYIPMSSQPTSSLGQFNRGLCFDIGFLYTKPAKFYVCHDNDLLVPKDFWQKLQANLSRNNYKVLQTYSDRFVWQTNEVISEMLLNNPSWFHTTFEIEKHCTRNAPGAKGGSLTISREAYFQVGGHDPHLFFGYAAEDRFFWEKAELFYEIGFAEDPRIPLVHLWHPNAANLNPFKNEMDRFFVMFERIPRERKLEYARKKAESFQRILEKGIKIEHRETYEKE